MIFKDLSIEEALSWIRAASALYYLEYKENSIKARRGRGCDFGTSPHQALALISEGHSSFGDMARMSIEQSILRWASLEALSQCQCSANL